MTTRGTPSTPVGAPQHDRPRYVDGRHHALVGGISSPCSAALMRAPGVSRVYVDMATEAIFVEHHTEQSTRADLTRIIELFGVRVSSNTRCPSP